MGNTFPNWMISLSSTKFFLNKLYIRGWLNLELLPPLGKLPHLEYLFISTVYGLQKVGVEFLGIESTNQNGIIIFSMLKDIYLESLYKWEEWIDIGGTKEEEEKEKENGSSTVTLKIMTRLNFLTIWYCQKLKSLPVPDFILTTPLQQLKIRGCPFFTERCE